MTIACFLTVETSASSGPDLRDRFAADAVPLLLGRGNVECVSLFAPDEVDDPYVDDGRPPEMVVQIAVPEIAALDALFAGFDIAPHLGMADGGTVSLDVFEALSYAIEKVADPGLRSAPMSFNVRYYAPVENERLFVDYYLKNHPQILAEMPAIRNVFCYVPVLWSNPTNIPTSNCILGNEVVFDSLHALNDALASDVRHRLREDYESFPVRPGPNTHFAMQRTDFMA